MTCSHANCDWLSRDPGYLVSGPVLFFQELDAPELIKSKTKTKHGVQKEWGFHCFGRFFDSFHQPCSTINISYQDSRRPSRSQKNQVWMQCLNFIWEVVIVPFLLAEGISGLLQRISDSSLISFYCLQCVWSMLCTYNIHLSKKDTCQHRDQTFPSPQGPHSHSPQFLFYFESSESSEMVAARICYPLFRSVWSLKICFSGTRARCLIFASYM